MNWKIVRKLSLALLCTTVFVGVLGNTACEPKASYVSVQNDAVSTSVSLFWDTDCPVAQAYSQRIEQLYLQEKDKTNFLLIFPNDGATDTTVQQYLKDYKVTIPYKIDKGAKLAKKFGVTIVPEVIVIDKSDNVIYRGAIDDSQDSTKVKNSFLKNAISLSPSGNRLKVKFTSPIGCKLTPNTEIASMVKATYADNIATILDRSCVGCHRPGQTAPFSLVGYANAKAKANMISVVTNEGRMPPWKATVGFGKFHDENVLSEAEVALLKNWADEGAPSGNLKKAPKPRVFPSGEWSLGTPNLIAAPSKAYEIYANGQDIYRHFVIKTNLTKTVWVKAVDVVPGNRRAVHHVITFLDNSGQGARLEAANKDGQLGYSSFGWPGFPPSGSFGGWAPGLTARFLPEGAAFELKPGEDLVIEVHYHPTGKIEKDLTKVGLYFAKNDPSELPKTKNIEKITNKVDVAWMLQPLLRIKPNDATSTHSRSFSIPVDYKIYSVMPHMHLLGKVMRATVVTPDGKIEPLVEIKDWDFNWQMNYALQVPKIVKAGSKIVVEAIYDNSKENPRNPNSPPKMVTWGEETTDEMFLLVVTGSPVNPNEKMDKYSLN